MFNRIDFRTIVKANYTLALITGDCQGDSCIFFPPFQRVFLVLTIPSFFCQTHLFYFSTDSLATTHRGDLHLTIGLPSIVARYEQTKVQVRRIIVDREGMAVEFLASLHAAGRIVVTVLRTDQYQDLASFSEIGCAGAGSAGSRSCTHCLPPSRSSRGRFFAPGGLDP
jgi:hypothetical protein